MEHLLQVLLTLVVLYTLARIGSLLFSRFGLPGLIGEILMGIVVANIAIGDWSLMNDFLKLDGSPDSVLPILEILAELGVIFLLFMVGLETKVCDLLKSGRAALFCAILGVVVPFALGFAYIMAVDGNMNHALFLAAAMVATSVGITARIIKDLHLIDTREARIIIAAAVIDDVLGMIVLAIVKGMVDSGEISIGNILSITIQAVLFVVAVIAICKWVVPRIYDFFEARKAAKGSEWKFSINKLALAIIVCLGMSALAEFIGLAGIIGAFLGGMIFADYAAEWGLEERVESLCTFMLSFFFLNVGLKVDIFALSDMTVVMMVVIVLVLAIISKLVGCSFGAKIGDRSLDRSSMGLIGFGMIPRGEVGIIIASIGLSAGAMTQDLYTVVVFMSVITTLIAPPVISRMFKKKYHDEYCIIASED